MTEKTPPRGRKLGVKVFEDVYMPELSNVFNTRIELLKKKTETKKLALRDVIKEDLGADEIVEHVAGLVHEAQGFERESEELAEKAVKILDKARAIIEITKIYQYETGYHQHAPDIKFEFTSEVTRMIDVALMLQPEWLDLKEVEHWRNHFLSKMRSSVTMEQCTEVIEEAREKVADLIQAGDK